MSHPSKRQCTRIDKAITELDALLTTPGPDGRNYRSIYSVLQFIFKEYCQSIESMNVLSKTDFKDYFLIIISFKDIPSGVANVLLSMLYNASKADDFFEDLLSSPIYDAVIKIFLKNPANFYRSLRFLSVSLSKNKALFIFPLHCVVTMMSYCKYHPGDNSAKNKDAIFKEMVIFLPAYVKKQVVSDWSTFLEENDISTVITTFKDFFEVEKSKFSVVFKPQEVLEIAKVSMAIIKHEETPADVKNSFKESMSDVIQWLSGERSSKSLEILLDLYHPKTLHYISYVAEKTRDSIFKEMLICPHDSNTRVKVLTIYLNLCQEGSYRTELVDRHFCATLINLMKGCAIVNSANPDCSEIMQNLRVISIVVSIFFIFNSGEKLIQYALDGGLYSSLLSLANYIIWSSFIDPKIFVQCQTILPKVFLLMQKTTDYKFLDKNHCKSLVSILKKFNSVNCLNYLLYLSFTVQFTHLIHNSFVSIVYHELDCSSLSAEDQYFNHKPLRSAPSSMRKIASFPCCGKMILSNVLHSLDPSTLSSPQALSESLLLLRKDTLICEILRNDLICAVLDRHEADLDIFSALLGNLSVLIKWHCSVSDDDSHILNESSINMGNIDDIEDRQVPIVITNGEIDINITKCCIVKSSPVLRNMFKHNFRETIESCIRLPYLSDDTLLCLKDILTGTIVNFSDNYKVSEHCYPWPAAYELLLFSIMFRVTAVFRIISSCLIHDCQYRNLKFPLMGLKLIFREMFHQIAVPLLKRFCQLKSKVFS